MPGYACGRPLVDSQRAGPAHHIRPDQTKRPRFGKFARAAASRLPRPARMALDAGAVSGACAAPASLKQCGFCFCKRIRNVRPDRYADSEVSVRFTQFSGHPLSSTTQQVATYPAAQNQYHCDCLLKYVRDLPNRQAMLQHS